MSPQCNIDAKGKAIRLIVGSLLMVCGLVMICIFAMQGRGWVAWTVALMVVAGGGFVIYEARAGWCIVRAMGFKTRF